ncbi:unnamed protein product [Ranitomeya imitator]|uniref:Reverse transcriptase domain-containing protein n=1 Tax=Ranitomeya imitator TaxID=111125 RepID=A0ABN9LAU9_9NEOB|nr:unnamed protein product [Ranitomeya imitator]
MQRGALMEISFLFLQSTLYTSNVSAYAVPFNMHKYRLNLIKANSRNVLDEMSFSTLSYNQEEVSSIISQVTTPGTFLHTPSEELRTRDFERDLKRLTSLDLHCITLAEYHRVQRIPRGLRVPLRPTLFHDNTEFCTKFESILNKCSMDLIVLTIDFLQKEITDLKIRITATEQQLNNTLSSEDFKTLKTKLDHTTTELRDNLQARKRSKFLRDTEDYKNNQVYRWQSSRYRRPTRRGYSPTSTISDTSSGTNPSRKTRRRSRRHRSGSRQNDDQIAGMETPNIVYNISSYCLSPSEMNLLQKGLTFCPVSRFNSFLLDQELHQFFRTLRLKAHFSGLPSIPPTEASSLSSFTLKDLNLRIPSSFQPPRTYHPVETFIEFVKKDIKVVLETIESGNLCIKHNLSIEEFRSLQSLKARKELIIKPADKGGAIVVLDRTYYMDEIRSQLRDTNTYLPISSNPSFDIAREIRDLTSHYFQLGIIDQKLVEFLNNQYPVIPVFYTLPKVHKNLARPPGRPIVASTNSLLSPLAITMDKILSPLVPLIQSYLKDTTHFLTSLRDVGVLPKGCTLVTMDVKAIFTLSGFYRGTAAILMLRVRSSFHSVYSNM